MNTKYKTGEIWLPYFKQGDDLSEALENSKTNEEALEAHAQRLDDAAKILRKIKEEIKGQDVEIDAGTHMITITAPGKLIDKLVSLDLASEFDLDGESKTS